MSEAAVIEKNTELSKRRRELNEQQRTQDEQERKLKKRRLFGRIFMAVIAVLIVVMIIVKYMIYFRPENVKIAENTKAISAVDPANYSISSGVFDMNTVLHIVDYKGNMLDENGKWIKAG